MSRRTLIMHTTGQAVADIRLQATAILEEKHVDLLSLWARVIPAAAGRHGPRIGAAVTSAAQVARFMRQHGMLHLDSAEVRRAVRRYLRACHNRVHQRDRMGQAVATLNQQILEKCADELKALRRAAAA